MCWPRNLATLTPYQRTNSINVQPEDVGDTIYLVAGAEIRDKNKDEILKEKFTRSPILTHIGIVESVISYPISTYGFLANQYKNYRNTVRNTYNLPLDLINYLIQLKIFMGKNLTDNDITELNIANLLNNIVSELRTNNKITYVQAFTENENNFYIRDGDEFYSLNTQETIPSLSPSLLNGRKLRYLPDRQSLARIITELQKKDITGAESYVSKLTTWSQNEYVKVKFTDELWKPLAVSRLNQGISTRQISVGDTEPLVVSILKEDIDETHDPNTKEKKSSSVNKNMIFYGPPGTGKTYSLAKYAVAIIENKAIEGIEEEIKLSGYETVYQRYKEYKEKGQLEFTTFHQSYSYEDFIEGIRPLMGEEEESQLRYDIIPGVFKEFCTKAGQRIVSMRGIENLLNDNPTVWKVSLYGAGENTIKKYCFENGCIRIGWDEYPDLVENIDINKTDLSTSAIGLLFDFEQGIKIGDLVVSLFNQNTIDGVGIVTGDYLWDPELPNYRRTRAVKWLMTGKKIDIKKLNDNVVLTLRTIYKLRRIDSKTLLDEIKEYISEEVKVTDKSKNYVFIIDEINRGNVSKVFGELITLIEEEKRLGEKEGMTIKLPYSRSEFGVPSNLHILGTMNTADRSIALIDTALRRRFKFIEMMPQPNILTDLENKELTIKDTDINVVNLLTMMNKRIELLYDREHTIGHAYLIELIKDNSLDNLANIFRHKIFPLLQEYFFDNCEKIRLVLGDNQTKDPNWQFIQTQKPDTNLFGLNVEDIADELVSYRINEKAFKTPEAYKKIYSITTA